MERGREEWGENDGGRKREKGERKRKRDSRKEKKASGRDREKEEGRKTVNPESYT